MAIDTSFYGTLIEATAYFDARLHEHAWSAASLKDRRGSLIAATRIIDTLGYKGYKAATYAVLQQYGLEEMPTSFTTDAVPTQEALREAEASQPLEFPRGNDTVVPEAIRVACYEIAHSLLDGKDPEFELENLAVVSHGYSSLRTTYSRNQVPIEHILNGVPSAQAWRLMRPFLRDGNQINLSRTS